MILKLKDGDVKIELFEDTAPNHVKRIQQLAAEGKYNGVVFHRVIDGFMAQTGDVQFGNSSNDNFNLSRAGTGGSELPDLKEEFSELPHDRGTLSMARSQDPNSVLPKVTKKNSFFGFVRIPRISKKCKKTVPKNIEKTCFFA